MKATRIYYLLIISINVYTFLTFLALYVGIWDSLDLADKVPVYFLPYILIPLNLVLCTAGYIIVYDRTTINRGQRKIIVINLLISLSFIGYLIICIFFMDTL